MEVAIFLFAARLQKRIKQCDSESALSGIVLAKWGIPVYLNLIYIVLTTNMKIHSMFIRCALFKVAGSDDIKIFQN